jgi:hypothetical protein
MTLIANLSLSLKTLTLSRSRVFSFFVGLGVLIFSLQLLPYGTEGDQYFYRRFYEGAAGLPYKDLMDFQLSVIGSIEPLYGLLAKLFSPHVDKDVFSAGLNFLLAYQIALYLRRLNVVWWMVLLIIFGNYYSYVLFFSAERLKLSLVFFLFFLNSASSLRFLGFVIAPLAHAQILILYFVGGVKEVGGRVWDAIWHGTLNKREIAIAFLALIVGLGLSIFLSSHILDKLGRYEGEGFSEIYKSAAFMVLALYFAPRKWECVVSFFPIIVVAYLIGDSRVNIFAFFLFFHYSLSVRRGANLINLALCIYFLAQGWGFLENIIKFGDGYA